MPSRLNYLYKYLKEVITSDLNQCRTHLIAGMNQFDMVESVVRKVENKEKKAEEKTIKAGLRRGCNREARVWLPKNLAPASFACAPVRKSAR